MLIANFEENTIELDPVLFTPQTLMEVNNEASQAAEKAAESQANYERLDKKSEDLLSEIKTKIDSGGEGKTSDTKLERLARCNNLWKLHVDELNAARLTFYKDRAEAKNKERKWQTIQSAISYLKEQIKRDIV